MISHISTEPGDDSLDSVKAGVQIFPLGKVSMPAFFVFRRDV